MLHTKTNFMQFHNEVIINQPLQKVIELFDNPDNLRHWQPSLVSFEHVRGEAGAPGAVSKLVYRMGKKEIEMIETIIERDLPRSFAATYEAKGVFNEVQNSFKALDENRTLYATETSFRFSGFMKVIGLLMPGAFRKQSQKFLEDFKAFAEKGVPAEAVH